MALCKPQEDQTYKNTAQMIEAWSKYLTRRHAIGTAVAVVWVQGKAVTRAGAAVVVLLCRAVKLPRVDYWLHTPDKVIVLR